MPGDEPQRFGWRPACVRRSSPWTGRSPSATSLALSVPVVQAMAQQVNGPIDFGVWGASSAISPTPIWRAKSGSTASSIRTCRPSRPSCNAAPAWPAYSRQPACSARRRAALAMVGGVESMSRVQFGLGENFRFGCGDCCRRAARRPPARIFRRLRPSDIRLLVPEVKNRVTGRSMGEHTEDMAKDWNIGRASKMSLRWRAIDARSRRKIAVFSTI